MLSQFPGLNPVGPPCTFLPSSSYLPSCQRSAVHKKTWAMIWNFHELQIMIFFKIHLWEQQQSHVLMILKTSVTVTPVKVTIAYSDSIFCPQKELSHTENQWIQWQSVTVTLFWCPSAVMAWIGTDKHTGFAVIMIKDEGWPAMFWGLLLFFSAHPPYAWHNATNKCTWFTHHSRGIVKSNNDVSGLQMTWTVAVAWKLQAS